MLQSDMQPSCRRGSRSRFFEKNNGLGDVGNWGSSRKNITINLENTIIKDDYPMWREGGGGGMRNVGSSPHEGSYNHLKLLSRRHTPLTREKIINAAQIRQVWELAPPIF
ncbi:hypothetical protein LXL04_022510 [Taraxacum kok-saghyz]